MYTFKQIVKLDFINLAKNPMWIFFSAPFPFLMVLILGFLSSGEWGTRVTAYDYYGITMLVYAALNTATISANSFMEERIKGGNLRIIHAPVRPFAIHFSKTLASFAFCSICHLATAIALYLVAGVHYGEATLPGTIAIFLLLEFFSSALGVAMCALFKSENVANQILSLAITALAILGGLFFRVDSLGKTAERASDAVAVKWAVKAIFSLVWDGDWSLVPVVSLSLAVASAALVGASALLFRTEDYL
jgi:ABC-2 type transport system permease protein